VAAAAVVVVLLFFRPVLAEFPSAALGAIVVYAAVRLVDITGFRRLFSFRPTEFALALATTVGVLVFDILYGVLVAIALSVLELLARVARPPSAVLGRVPGLAGLHDVADWEGAVTVPGLVVFRYDAPLFFANAENLRTQVVGVLDAQDARVEWLVLNVEATVEIDATAADALDGLCDELDRRGVRLGLARMKQDLRDQLARTGLLERIGADMIFPTLPTALEAFARRAPGR
jgi:MFS superfamily sulfate permease-like transporter